MGIADQIIQVESGGNPNARNPNSSAGGLGQFTDATWLNTIKAHRPDLASQYSTSDLLKMKSDPKLSLSMTDALAGDNTAFLRSRNLPTTPGNVYLAHFAGPAGAASLLNAHPEARVENVLSPEAIKANPFLKNMTVADIQRWASGKMGGGAQPAQGAYANPASGAIPTSVPGAPAAAEEPADPSGGVAAIPGIIQQLQQQQMQPMKPVHIDTPETPGMARARALVRAMAQRPLPVTGGQA